MYTEILVQQLKLHLKSLSHTIMDTVAFAINILQLIMSHEKDTT